MNEALHSICEGLIVLGLVSTAFTGLFHYKPTGKTGPLMASVMVVLVAAVGLVATQ